MAGRKSNRIKIFQFISLALVASLLSTAAIEIYYATKYHTQVKVIKKRYTVGINPLPDALDFGDLPKGGEQTRFVNLSNKSSRDAYIYIYVTGNISSFIKLKKTLFPLKAKKTKRIDFPINIPATANYKIYEGTVYIFKLPKILS